MKTVRMSDEEFTLVTALIEVHLKEIEDLLESDVLSKEGKKLFEKERQFVEALYEKYHNCPF